MAFLVVSVFRAFILQGMRAFFFVANRFANGKNAKAFRRIDATEKGGRRGRRAVF